MTQTTVANFRQSVKSAMPNSFYSALRKLKRMFQDHVDYFYFPFWLLFQCVLHRKRAVILFRPGALGDVVCTLPMCAEIRQRHPERLLIYVTLKDYVSMVRISNAVDCMYGSFWKYGTWHLPAPFCFGLVDKLYIPQTTDERSPNTGAQAHLAVDLAVSCGLTLPESNRQPRLFPPPELVKIVQTKYGFAEAVAAGRLIIGINCGQVWPVRMWPPAKWQALLAMIHAEYDAAILQFGFRKGENDEYDDLKGVQFELRMMMEKDELVALVANCHLIVSVDSGPVHLAGAVGVPLVGLYGALEPRHFLPPASPSVGVFSEVPCRFCNHTTPIGHWKSGCPNDIRCMKELEAAAVFQAVKDMLSKQQKTPPFTAATARENLADQNRSSIIKQ